MDDSQPVHPAIRGLKTVCRCNNIKYRTIERAIREGARTVDDVAKKTGATTGHCGGSCTPDIQQMLTELVPNAVAAAEAATDAPQPPHARAGSRRTGRQGAGAAPSSFPLPPQSGGAAADSQPWWVRKK